MGQRQTISTPQTAPAHDESADTPYPKRERRAHISRGPCAFRQLRLDDAMLAYLIGDSNDESNTFACSPDALLRLHGAAFAACVDYPQLPEHMYIEGNMHGLAHSSPVASMSPRTGLSVEKPAAPRRLRAFLRAFKTLNNPWVARCFDGVGAPAELFHAFFLDDNHFADLAVQSHWGSAVTGDDVAFHLDGPNSVLHMAISLHGSRTLLTMEVDPAASPEDITEFSAPGVEKAVEQRAGDIYISSPYSILHGVQYRESSWADRALAIQCRFLFKTGDRLDDLQTLRPREMPALMERVAEVLREADIRLPSMEHVLAAEAELRGLEEAARQD